MTPTRINRINRISLLALACASLTVTATADIKREVVEQHALEGVEEVHLEISGGNLELRGSDRSDLELTLDYKFGTRSDEEADDMLAEVKRSVTRDGDRLVIKIEYASQSQNLWQSLFGDGNSMRIDAELEVPRHVRTHLRTSGGNIAAQSLDAPVVLRTSGGNIHAQRLNGPLDVGTSGGNISVSDLNGHAKLRTSGGNISISGAVTALDAHTSGGNITATFQQGLTDASELDTNGGHITARLPREQGFQLQAKTRGGKVNYSHGGALEGSVEKNQIDATVNGGGPALSARTSGGNITIATL